MNYTIETDAEAETRRRSGAIDGRYQICHPDVGLVECADIRSDAFAIADRCAAQVLRDGTPAFSDPYAFEVYDRMARRGYARTWRRQPKNGTHCWEYGDRYSDLGNNRWKCIAIRGRTPRQTDDLTQRVWS